MTNKMEIELALANLEAGKFSFRMVETIKEQLVNLDREVKLLRGLHGDAMTDLRKQQLANWRLEGEAQRLNAKIFALLRANIFTEKAFQATRTILAETKRQLASAHKKSAPATEKFLEKTYDGMAALALKLIKLANRTEEPVSRSALSGYSELSAHKKKVA